MKYIPIILISVCIAMTSCNKDREFAVDPVLTDVTSLNDYNSKISEGVSLLFFHATWCPKCAAQRPAIEDLTGDASLKGVFFGQVNYEKIIEVTNAAKVVGFPTIVFYKNGTEVIRFSGQGHSKDKIRNQLIDLVQ